MTAKLHPGDLFAELYLVEGLIGEGGTSLVYAAQDTEEGRAVALKILKVDELNIDAESSAPSASLSISGSTSTRSAQIMFKELAVTTRLTHPQIVKVLDFGVSQDGRSFIVMERLLGEDLSAYMKRTGRMRVPELIPMFCGALEALATAHAQGFSHQDIKPSNLFLTSERGRGPELVVMDFGIARRAIKAPKEEPIAGSLPYLAPEYLKSRVIHPTGDVYQLGLTLIELLTGARVIQERSGMLAMSRHIAGDLRLDPRLLMGQIGATLLKAVTLEPTARFQDAGELLHALRQVPEAELLELESRLSAPLSGEQSASLGSTSVLASAPSDVQPRSAPAHHSHASPASPAQAPLETCARCEQLIRSQRALQRHARQQWWVILGLSILCAVLMIALALSYTSTR